jgi:hypothetical protein
VKEQYFHYVCYILGVNAFLSEYTVFKNWRYICQGVPPLSMSGPR